MRSMTGYGQSESIACGLSIEMVIKSVNHKALDFSFRLPRRIYSMENPIRIRLQEEISRGRIEVNILIRPVEAQLSTLTIDMARADAVKEALDTLSDRYGITEPISLSYWLQTPDLFVEVPAEIDEQELQNALLEITGAALTDFIGMRTREGLSLKRQFEENLRVIRTLVDSLEEHVGAINEEQHRKMRVKMEELLQSEPEFAESRLKQEILFYLDKSDIREEMTRLRQHLDEFALQMEENGPVGKRLDFLAQEMNREANTIASKSQHVLQTRSAIDMKVQIEQIREQIMNIE